ncbi:MAG: MATE family efflux transporter [Clostridia bacterium]|nr:MATE family efflux transporter [Clostridia bacterium]
MTRDMTTGSPLARILAFCAPLLVGNLFQQFYNLADSIIVGRLLGVNAFAAVGSTGALNFLVLGFALGICSGFAIPIAQSFGAGDEEAVRSRTGQLVWLGLIFSLGLTVLTFFTTDDILRLINTPAEIYDDAYKYIFIVFMGAGATILYNLSSSILRALGDSRTPLLFLIAAVIVNVVLDILFMATCGMGVEGAALATVISQAASALWVVSYLCSRRSSLRIRPRYLRPRREMLRRICALGVSPLIMQLTESAVSLVLNNGLQAYGGDLYVGSMTILNSVMQIVFALNNGFASGVQPIISYNYGARNFDRVKQAFIRLISVTLGLGAVFSLLVALFPAGFAGLFTDNPELIALTAKVLPIFTAGMWIFGLQTGCQNTFVGLGQAKISLFIALLRKVFLMIPLALLLPKLFGLGVWGVYLSEPVADILSACCTGLIFLRTYQKILSEEALNRV